jgi:hypothetical protein
MNIILTDETELVYNVNTSILKQQEDRTAAGEIV